MGVVGRGDLLSSTQGIAGFCCMRERKPVCSQEGFFFPPFLATPRHKEFPGQGSDRSCSCNLCHSCSSVGSLTQCAGLRIETASQHSRDAADPVVPQWELL